LFPRPWGGTQVGITLFFGGPHPPPNPFLSKPAPSVLWSQSVVCFGPLLPLFRLFFFAFCHNPLPPVGSHSPHGTPVPLRTTFPPFKLFCLCLFCTRKSVLSRCELFFAKKAPPFPVNRFSLFPQVLEVRVNFFFSKKPRTPTCVFFMNSVFFFFNPPR